MPEGDAVWYTARRLHEALAGRALTRSDFRVPRLATADLTGDVVTETVSRGKHLLTRTSGGLTVHTHLRMDGSWRIRPAVERMAESHRIRLVLANEAWQAIGYQLGVVELLRTSHEDQVTGHLGPDLLGPDWDCAEAVRLARRRTRPAHRRGPARPAQPGGYRQHLQGRSPVPARHQSVAPGRRGPRSRHGGRAGLPTARCEQGAARPGHDRQLAPGRGDVGVRQARPSVPALRHAHPLRGPAGPGHVLVPVVPAGGLRRGDGVVCGREGSSGPGRVGCWPLYPERRWCTSPALLGGAGGGTFRS